MKNNSSDNKVNTMNFGSSIIADGFTKNLSEATESVFKDANNLRRICNDYSNCNIKLTQGRAFEFLEVLKFNREAAKKGSDLRAEATHYNDPHSSSDINIYKNDQLIREVQAKSYGTSAKSVYEQTNKNYEDMDRLIPKDQKDKGIELLNNRISASSLKKDEYCDVRKNLSGELKYEDISSGGTTRAEAEITAKNPDMVSGYYEIDSAINEIGSTAVIGGGIGVSAAIVYNAIHKGWLLSKQNNPSSKSVTEVLTSSLKAGAKSSIVSGGAKTISFIARQVGETSFVESTGPTAIAATIFSVSKNVSEFCKGNISKDELMKRSGGDIFKGTSTFYYGIAGQMLIPVPIVGGLVGSMVGYLASSVLLQAGILGIGANNVAEIAKKRRLLIEEECNKAIIQLSKYRNEIIKIQSEYNDYLETNIISPLMNFENALMNWNPNDMVNHLFIVNKAFNVTLPFRNFEEFDEFMLDDNTKLII